MNIKHSSESNIWYTPADIMSRVHSVIGYPDLDPASDHEANQVVKASRIITEDSLGTPWFPVENLIGSVFLNPPGGKFVGKSQAGLFWRELIFYHNLCRVTESIYIGFSLESLAVNQNYAPMLPGTSICIPQRRIQFDSPGGTKAKSPTHANVIIYTPGRDDHSGEFYDAFESLGLVFHNYQPQQNP